MRPRSVCLIGGSGFVGTALATRLVRDGHHVTVLTRDRVRSRHLLVMPGLDLVQGSPHDPATLERLFAGQDVVINLVGILNEPGRSGAGFRHAHAELTRKVVTACRRQRVARLLQMSSLKADAERGPSQYLRSKGEAERIIRDECGEVLRWTIFQPSVIFGSGDSFINRFAGLLQLLPGFLPLARSTARFAPVWVEDVVEAFVVGLENDATAGETYQLCGPKVYTLRELVEFTRDALGLRRTIIGLPDWASRLQAAVMDFVPGKPFSTDNYRSLTIDSVCTENGFARLGLQPHSLEPVVARYLGTAGLQSRYARYRKRAGR